MPWFQTKLGYRISSRGDQKPAFLASSMLGCFSRATTLMPNTGEFKVNEAYMLLTRQSYKDNRGGGWDSPDETPLKTDLPTDSARLLQFIAAVNRRGDKGRNA
jgi:hypothetical protein